MKVTLRFIFAGSWGGCKQKWLSPSRGISPHSSIGLARDYVQLRLTPL